MLICNQKNPDIVLSSDIYLYGTGMFKDNFSLANLEKFKSDVAYAMACGKSFQLSIAECQALTQLDGQVDILSGLHQVYVTGISDEGLQVISWGRDYIIKFTDLFNRDFNVIECELTIPGIDNSSPIIDEELIKMHQENKQTGGNNGPKL